MQQDGQIVRAWRGSQKRTPDARATSETNESEALSDCVRQIVSASACSYALVEIADVSAAIVL